MNELTDHVVLGGSGVIGRETVGALVTAGLPAVSVSRAAAEIPGAVSRRADLLDPEATRQALATAEVAYLTVGLPYRAALWERQWPTIMRNVTEACRATGTALVYLDNVYSYGATDAPMTEATPIRPTSRKGRLRAELLRMLAEASADGAFRATVGRSADFYGPGATTSVFNGYVIDRAAAGTAPVWLLDATQPHSMTYTPDIGRALVTLGTDARAAGRTWHLPTAPPLTGADYMAIATGDATTGRTMSASTLRMGALFVGAARESLELSYQQTQPYRFDSTDFEETFGVVPTDHATGIATALAARRRE